MWLHNFGPPWLFFRHISSLWDWGFHGCEDGDDDDDDDGDEWSSGFWRRVDSLVDADSFVLSFPSRGLQIVTVCFSEKLSSTVESTQRETQEQSIITFLNLFSCSYANVSNNLLAKVVRSVFVSFYPPFFHNSCLSFITEIRKLLK
jgi:hypothetical protein